MTQNTTVSHWFVTENDRAKAQIKYELNYLENQLYKLCDVHAGTSNCPDAINLLCTNLSEKYLSYLTLLIGKNTPIVLDNGEINTELHWSHRINVIVNLKTQLSNTTQPDENSTLIKKIISHYQQFKIANIPQVVSDEPSAVTNKNVDELNKLFLVNDLKLWLCNVVNFCNKYSIEDFDLSLYFRDWKPQQRQNALNHFSNFGLVALSNAIFFYKLYPDKLFAEFIHPEKLVSVRMRVVVIHQCIEMLQSQLYSDAKQHGVKPGIDFLFHGDELPQGIMIEVNEGYREMIQHAVKKITIHFTPENEQQVTLERLQDLGYAYKFWFNPNRLIDAVMVLQQRLVKEKVNQDINLELFQNKMVALFGHLTTTECLNLYGYFANNDSRYLLYTLFTITQEGDIDWLPPLDVEDKNAVHSVFQALQSVMEALRIALKSRHVTTQPYLYDLGKQQIKVGRRNREAVFRILAIYGGKTVTVNENVEKLFTYVEEGN